MPMKLIGALHLPGFFSSLALTWLSMKDSVRKTTKSAQIHTGKTRSILVESVSTSQLPFWRVPPEAAPCNMAANTQVEWDSIEFAALVFKCQWRNEVGSVQWNTGPHTCIRYQKLFASCCRTVSKVSFKCSWSWAFLEPETSIQTVSKSLLELGHCTVEIDMKLIIHLLLFLKHYAISNQSGNKQKC